MGAAAPTGPLMDPPVPVSGLTGPLLQVSALIRGDLEALGQEISISVDGYVDILVLWTDVGNIKAWCMGTIRYKKDI